MEKFWEAQVVTDRQADTNAGLARRDVNNRRSGSGAKGVRLFGACTFNVHIEHMDLAVTAEQRTVGTHGDRGVVERLGIVGVALNE